MATKKRASAQSKIPASKLKQYRKELKSKGLFSKRTSLRGKVTKAQERQIRKYQNVVMGNAKIFTAPKKDAARLRKLYGLTGSGETIIVPKNKGDKISFNKKNSEITIKNKRGKRVYSPDFQSRPIPAGQRLFYTLEFARGGDTEKYRFEDYEMLEKFMHEYEVSGRWKNWRAYVVLDYLDKDEIAEARDDGDRINPRRKAKGRAGKVAGKISRAAKSGIKTRSPANRRGGKRGKS